MAGASDWIQAGQVPIDAATQAGQGASLAIAFQKHQMDVQNFQDQQNMFKQKQAEWATGHLQSILSVSNPRLRARMFEDFQRVAQHTGVDVSPGMAELVKDQDWVDNAQRGLAQMANLPYNDKTKAQMDLVGMLGDPAQAEKAVQLGALQNQRYNTNVQAQISGMQMQREMSYHSMEQSSKDFNEISERNKDQFEALRSANFIKQTLSNPKAGPIEVADAKGVLDKIVNQGAVLRPQTMTMLGDSSQGLVGDAKALTSELEGHGKITLEQRDQLLKIASRFADSMNVDLLIQKRGYQRTHPGVDADFVYSKMPEYNIEDPQAQHALNAPPQQSGFAALHPDVQAGVQKFAAKQGIQLDPASPNFTQQVTSLYGKIAPQTSTPPSGSAPPAGVVDYGSAPQTPASQEGAQ